MGKLDEYIGKVKKYKEQNPNISEMELVRYVYLDLGKRFSFDINCVPFGNKEKRKKIYRRSRNESTLNETMETNIGICSTFAQILENILKQFGVEIETIRAINDERRYAHVYNVIWPKGGKPYILDLQEDIYNIQSHSITKNFGLSFEDGKTQIIPRKVLEQMDRKLGYIDDKNYYADDYLYLLKLYMSHFEDFGERVKFVLENIEGYDNPNMSYIDMQWHHARILEELFSDKEFNYASNNRKIRMLDCYKDRDGKREYLNCIAVQTKHGIQMYIYDRKKCKYTGITLENFAKAVKNGLVLYQAKVQGLAQELKKIEEER